MNRKRLIYHKNNIEQAQQEMEKWIAHKKDADHDDLYLYASLKGIANAVGYLLDEKEREDRNGK